jgi:hypothetical protein
MKTKWNSLSDLKNYLTTNKLEKVVDFNGHELVTEKHVYTLAFRKLNTKKRVDTTN